MAQEKPCGHTGKHCTHGALCNFDHCHAEALERAPAQPNVITLVRDATKSALPADTPARLRELADDVENGKVGGLVIAAERLDEFEFHLPSSMNTSLVLATLLHAHILDKYRA